MDPLNQILLIIFIIQGVVITSVYYFTKKHTWWLYGSVLIVLGGIIVSWLYLHDLKTCPNSPDYKCGTFTDFKAIVLSGPFIIIGLVSLFSKFYMQKKK